MPPRLWVVVPLVALSTHPALAQKPIEVFHPSGKWQPRTAADHLAGLRSDRTPTEPACPHAGPPSKFRTVGTPTNYCGSTPGYCAPQWYRYDSRLVPSPFYVQPAPCQPYDPSFYDTYERDRIRALRDELRNLADQRAGHLMNQWSELFEEGLARFREGDYERALVSLLGAAYANQGSAAPRLHAAHAAFALGRYDEALNLVARAFELSPMLLYKRYDIRDEYGDRRDFDMHFSNLREFASKHRADPSASALLGYVTFFTHGPTAARADLERAFRLDRQSYFIPKLLTLARACGSPQDQPPFNKAAPKSDGPAMQRGRLVVMRRDDQPDRPVKP